jgi:uncharacterized repeat protein (TIGR01451 family)
MKSFLNRYKRVGLACVALGAIGISEQALAAGTASGTTISNTASVNYQVSGVTQPVIQSSPTGNSTSTGTATTFVVDNKVNLTVTRQDTVAFPVTPGGTNFYTTYKLTNTGNTAQGYQLAAANEATGTTNPFGTPADAFDMTAATLRRFVSTAACSTSTSAPTYAPATDTAVLVNTLAPDACVYVFVVGDTPAVATNGQVSVVRLTATTTAAGTNAAAPLGQTVGADTVGVDVVFADTVGHDGLEFDNDAYVVATAALSVAKTQALISDPFNNATNPKAIPGAIVEYSIRLTNSGSTNATVVSVTDSLPTNGITFTTGTYNGGNSDVRIVSGATTTFCVAEAGTDTNGDGCLRTAGGVLTVGSPALSSVPTGGVSTQVTVSFRMTITP